MLTNEDTVYNCIDVPDNAAGDLRLQLGLAANVRPKIAFIPGPGDVFGSFEYWADQAFDPRVPVIAYSTQFYSLVDKLAAQALIIHQYQQQANYNDQFYFEPIVRKHGEGKINYFIINFLYAIKILRILHQFKPDIVLVSTDAPSLLLLLMPKRWKKILTAHNTFWCMGKKPAGLKKNIKFSLIGHALKKLSAAVCTSPECARQIGHLTANDDNLHVEIPQFLKKNDLKKPQNLIDQAAQTFIYLGRIEENKGIFDLLDAFEQLAEIYPDLKLFYAGSGGFEKALEARINATKADVTFLGKLTASAVHDILIKTDILVCPTRSAFNEGLALVCIEAAIHGVPSVMSSIVPASELLTDGCVVFPVDDKQALKSALEKLIKHPENIDKLRSRLLHKSDQFFDRSKSWGKALYKAIQQC